MKKILTVFLLIAVSLLCLAAKPFEFNIGASGTYNGGYNDIVAGAKPELGDFSFGLDADVKLLFVDVDTTALYTKVNEEHILNGVASANLSLDVFFLRISAGIGYDYVYNITTKQLIVAGKDNFDNFFDNSFYLRGAIEFLLDTLHAGIFAIYPVEAPIGEFIVTVPEIDWQKVLQGATFGLSVKINLI